MAVVKAYSFALDPRPDQTTAFLSHRGGRRFAYNYMLALVKANLEQREAERSYGIVESELTPHLDWSAYGLRKAWNSRKGSAAPWWSENSKEAYASGCADLAAALQNWRDSKQGRRAGRPMGFPRFKTRRSRLSCSFTTGTIRVDADRRHITLPCLGTIRTCENTAKLHRHLRRGTGRILSATLSQARGGRWFVSFTCEIEHRDRAPERPAAVVADRWTPSSKTCSDCGAARAKLRLSERTYRCEHCGLVLDRDHNAARNLANLVRAAVDLELPGDVTTARQKPRKTGLAGSGTAAGRRPDKACQAYEARIP